MNILKLLKRKKHLKEIEIKLNNEKIDIEKNRKEILSKIKRRYKNFKPDDGFTVNENRHDNNYTLEYYREICVVILLSDFKIKYLALTKECLIEKHDMLLDCMSVGEKYHYIKKHLNNGELTQHDLDMGRSY